MADDLNIDGSPIVEAPAWVAQLPDNLKGNETFKSFKTIGDLGSRFLEVNGEIEGLNSKLSNAIPKLGENPTPEEISNFRKAFGVPDTPDDYKIERPTQIPEGWIFDETLEKKIKETAHQANSTPQQFNKFYQTVIAHEMELYSNIVKSIDENRQKAVDTLKAMWPGDAYKEKGENSMKSFEKFLDFAKIPEALGGKEGMKKWVVENGLGDDPRMVWMFSEFFNLIGDDRFIAGSPGAGRLVAKGTLDFSKSMPQK